jgi:NAD(P)-dependent dehydrogenase (short-subunit alcohol dehydrogenase family)
LEDLFSFEDNVIIITGGAGTIGSAVVELFSELGANLVISDINEAKVNEVANRTQDKTGNEILPVVADLPMKTSCRSWWIKPSITLVKLQASFLNRNMHMNLNWA